MQCGRNYHVSLRIYYYVIFFRRSVDSPSSFLSFFAHLPNHLRFIQALYPKCIQNTKYILYAIQFVLRRILNPTCPASNRLPNNPKGGSNLFRLEDFFKSITSYFWLYSSRGNKKGYAKSWSDQNLKEHWQALLLTGFLWMSSSNWIYILENGKKRTLFSLSTALLLESSAKSASFFNPFQIPAAGWDNSIFKFESTLSSSAV